MDFQNLADNPIPMLKSLKNLLDRGKVSLLVGSGFSKNVSDAFPNWSELLYDMVFEMYSSEIEMKKNKKQKDSVDHKENIRQIIREIIEREGYLEIVSQYIKRKGFRESIDAYIEQHIPIIEKKLETEEYKVRFIHSESEGTLVIAENLDLHQQLISLKWNNIFTTNYDNAIECAYEDKKIVFDNIFNEIEQMRTQIKENSTTIQSALTTNENPSNLETVKLSSLSSSSILAFKDDPISAEEKVKELEKANRNLNFEITERIIKLDNDRINIVKDSSELELQKNRNIIKLHGSIPTKKENEIFGFDRDVHKRYIISKEDYQDYPKQHEAFTQLMRITLLQDSFCLIGFSGIDPNFIAWISWVRDIIERKPFQTTDNQASPNNKYKIYLIDVENEKLTVDKELFFRNHRIARIPLASKEIRTFLEIEDGTGNDKKMLLGKFFTFLSKGADGFIEDEKLKSYRQIWEGLSKSVFGNIKDKKSLAESIDKLWDLRFFSQISIFDIYNQNVSTDFIRYIDKNLKEFDFQEILQQFFRLLTLAINDSYLVYSSKIIPAKTLEQINHIVPKPFLKTFKLLELRNAILSSDNDTANEIFNEASFSNDDELIHEKALHYAFNFDFSGLLHHLKNWSPKSNYHTVLKASLLAQILPKEAYSLMENFVYDSSSFSTLSHQEKINSYYILLFTKSSVKWEKNEKIHDKIDELKKLGAKEIHHNVNVLVDKINKKVTNSIQPYPRGEFESYYHMAGNEKFLLGIQFMQYLNQSGLFLEVQNARFIESKDWYAASKLIYEEYPLPTLFYSLQYLDANFTKRVGQDFVNSEKLKGRLLSIFKTLSDTYSCEVTPERFKISILYFLSEIIAAIPSEDWEQTFLDIWNISLKHDLQFSETAFHVHSFVERSLSNLSSFDSVEYIINSLLENRHKSDLVTKYLYLLSSRNKIRDFRGHLVNTPLSRKIDKIIDEIPTEFIRSMYLLGNLEPIISSKQKNNIKEILENFDLTGFDNYNIWRTVLFFAQKSKKVKANIKKAILASSYIFSSGIEIKDDGRLSATQTRFIRFHNLIRNKFSQNNLGWTKKESLSLYNSLRTELIKIEKWGNRDRILLDIKSLLDEMKFFLNNEKDKLYELPDYNETVKRIDELLVIEKGEGSLIQRLMSDNNEYYYYALDELTQHLFDNRTEASCENCIEFILSKIISQSVPNLLFTLKMLATSLRELKNDGCLTQYSEKLSLILERYQLHDFKDNYKPSYFLYLSTIAMVLKHWGIENEVVTHWLTQKNNSNYNIVSKLTI